MRTGKPGKWWVLADTLPNGEPVGIYWTGEYVGETLLIPEMTFDKRKACQFGDRPAALFAHSMFGLPSAYAPLEMEFAQAGGAS